MNDLSSFSIGIDWAMIQPPNVIEEMLVTDFDHINEIIRSACKLPPDKKRERIKRMQSVV
jgi:hypothetical protein